MFKKIKSSVFFVVKMFGIIVSITGLVLVAAGHYMSYGSYDDNLFMDQWWTK